MDERGFSAMALLSTSRRRLIAALRLAAVAVSVLSLWTVGAMHVSASQPPCPAGEIPNWNAPGCMQTQTALSLSGYGIPTQGKNLPEAGKDGAPAIQRCNGAPIPFGQPCPTTAEAQAQAQARAPSATLSTYLATLSAASTTSQPSITVSLPPPGGALWGPAATVADPAVPATTSPTQLAATSSAASPVTLATPPDPTAELQGLLGDWYTNWMAYLTASFNWNQTAAAAIASAFAAIPACANGQADDCQAAIWQQIGPWANPAPSGSQPASGSLQAPHLE